MCTMCVCMSYGLIMLGVKFTFFFAALGKLIVDRCSVSRGFVLEPILAHQSLLWLSLLLSWLAPTSSFSCLRV